MKLKTQIIIQLSIWLAGMFIDYLIEGHVLIGGLLGTIIGLALVLVIATTPNEKYL